MNNDTTIAIGLVFAIVNLLILVWNFFNNYKKTVKEDMGPNKEIVTQLQSLNESVLKMNFKTDQICATTNETRTDLKSMRNDLEQMRETLVIHKMEIASLKEEIEKLKRGQRNA